METVLPEQRETVMLPSAAPAAGDVAGDLSLLTPPSSPPRILLICSNGGHLAQLLVLKPWWAQCQRRWVTFELTDAVSQLGDESVTWAYHPTTRNVRNLLRNAWLSVKVLRDFRPDLIVSTGAAVALPFFMLGRALGIPTVFIEVYDRMDSRTLTGRLCRPFTTLFLVQWEEQQLLYPDSVLVGPLL